MHANTTNQFAMTCDHAEDAIPCEQSSQFHYLNDLLGQEPSVPLHSDQDIERAAQYGSRTLTARAQVAAADRGEAAERPITPTIVTTTTTGTQPRRRTRVRTRNQRTPAAEEVAASS